MEREKNKNKKSITVSTRLSYMIVFNIEKIKWFLSSKSADYNDFWILKHIKINQYFQYSIVNIFFFK